MVKISTQAWIKFERGHRHQGKYYEAVIPSGNPIQTAARSNGLITLDQPAKKDIISYLQTLLEDIAFYIDLWNKLRADIEMYAVPSQAAVTARSVESMFDAINQGVEDIRVDEKSQNRAEWFKKVARVRMQLGQVKEELNRVQKDMEDVIRQANVIRIANMMNTPGVIAPTSEPMPLPEIPQPEEDDE